MDDLEDTGADDSRDTIPGCPRVGVFGGSFNPPHIAHVLAVVYALEVAPIDEVLVVPVFQHPFAKELAPFEDRMAMCQAAMGWIPGASISDVEQQLGGDSLTLRTLTHLSHEHPDWVLRLLVGADVLADLPKWHRFDKIAELAPPIVLGRAGVASEGGRSGALGMHAATSAAGLRAPEPLLPRISSTEIRSAILRRDLDSVRPLLPARVLSYIEDHGLYREA